MSMRKTLTLNWDDKDYNLLVTMQVIDKLEDHINLALMNKRTSEGDIRFSHVAHLLSLLLNEAGCKVSQSEVYESLYLGGHIKPQDLYPLLEYIWEAVFPEPEKK